MKAKKTRLELITEIKEMELRKTTFEAILDDCGDYYCKDISITVQLNTEMYQKRRKYDGDSVDVNKVIFLVYLKAEIESLEIKINELIGEITK